jgi:hypothetical protein
MPETFTIRLGGKRWEIERLPWRLVRKVQPRVLALNREIAQGEESDFAMRLTAERLDEMTDLVVMVLQEVEPQLTREAVENMVLRADELVSAQVAIMGACGLATSQPVIDGSAGADAAA